MPHVEVPQAELKLVILGDANCGKTSLVTRFTQGYYRQQHHNTSPTPLSSSQSIQQSHNPNFVTKSIPVTSSNIPTKIQIWDVAGSNSTNNSNSKHNHNNNNNSTVNGAHTAAKCYYSTSSAILLGYDVTSRSSYEGMRSWLNELRGTISFSVVVVAIVALKTDLLHHGNNTHGVNNNNNNNNEVVQEYEVEQLAQALNVLYVPTSSKLDVNVTSLFSRVAEEVLLRRKRGALLGMGHNGGVQWNKGGQLFSNGSGGGGRTMPQSRGSNSTRDKTRPSSPIMSSKELYGKYYEGDSATNTADSKHDHRDDSNTSSSMMLPYNGMVNGNNNDIASKDNDGNTATATITSSSNTDMRSTPVAMSEATAVGDGKEGGGQNEYDITMEVDSNKNDVLDGEKEDGENNGSFFMMCGVCGNTSDIIE